MVLLLLVLYTAFLLDQLVIVINYNVIYNVLATYPCPQNCGGNGDCDENLEQCVCYRGYFDEDCTTQATEITENQAGYDISVGDNQFFFYELLGIEDIRFWIN